jgi:hypothetical protein
MLQRLRKDLWTFFFQVADSTVYAIGQKSVHEAGEKMSGDYEAMDWPRLLPGSRWCTPRWIRRHMISPPMWTRNTNRSWSA